MTRGESDLDSLVERVERMWLILWEQRTDEVAVAKAEVAPGSPADIKRAEALWSALRAVMKVAGECDEARGRVTAADNKTD